MKEAIQLIKRIKIFYKQLICKHEKFDCDILIRTIECKKCAWIDDYRNIYIKHL